MPPPPTPTPAPQPQSVSIRGVNQSWAPPNVRIAPGGTVTWSWSGDLPHNLSVPGAGIQTDVLTSHSVSYTFATPGTYTFECQVHPSTMQGSVTVQ